MTHRILILTQWCEPEPSFKGVGFAKELIKQGFEVEILTGFPNYPGGRLYPGYAVKLLQREIVEGVHITRVPLYPSHDRSAVRRILNYVSFAASSLIYGLFFIRRPDVIYVYHPPLTVGLTACLLRFLRRVPVVYDIQDMWPDTLRATGMLNHKTILSMIGFFCRWVYGLVDHIVVLSPGFKRLLTNRGVPESKIEVIYNWADEARLANREQIVPAELQKISHFKLLFAGNVGRAQGIKSIVLAAQILQERRTNVSIIILGGGLDLDRVKAEVDALGVKNMVFIPQVPITRVGGYLDSADALLVHLQANELFKVTIPSKTQAYMVSGKPILMAVDGDASDLVGAAGCGIKAKSEDPESIVEAVSKLAAMSPHERQQMGQNGLNYYREYLSLAAGTKKFSKLFKDVIQNYQESL